MDRLNSDQDYIDITEAELKKFLKSPENIIKYNLRFFEALFIKYMEDHNYWTLEGFDMLLARTDLNRWEKREIVDSYEKLNLPTFNEAIRSRITNITVIAHMLIPILTINNVDRLKDIDLRRIVRATPQFNSISDKLKHVGAYDKQIYNAYLNKAIKHYEIAGFIEYEDKDTPIIKMSEYQAENELKRYRKAYGNSAVGSLDYSVKENVVK